METQSLFSKFTESFPPGSNPYKYHGNPQKKTKKLLKEWKIYLNALSREGKKTVFLETISKIQKCSTLSLKQLTTYYRALQDLALSPRVSNLCQKKYFIRQYDQYYPRPPIAVHIPTYLKNKYNQDILFVTSIEKFPESTDFKVNKATWVLFKHKEHLHMTLFRVTQTINSIKMEIFDSLGARPDTISKDGRPYPSNLWRILKKLEQGGRPIEVWGADRQRQADSCSCAFFVESDLSTALNLKATKTPLFKEEKKAHPDFFKISQMREHIESNMSDPNFLRTKSKYPSSICHIGNLKAMLLALAYFETLVKEKITFTLAGEDLNPGEESEEDVENCIIS